MKKIATTGIAGSALLATTGSASAKANYTLTIEQAGTYDGTYEVFIPEGGDGDLSITEKNGTAESEDEFYSETNGAAINGRVDVGTIDEWNIEDADDPVVRESRCDNVTILVDGNKIY